SISAHAAISIQNNVLHTSAHQTTALLHQHIQQISSGETTEKGISLPLTNNSNPSSLSIWITAMSAIEATESYEQGLVSIYIVSSFIKPQYDAIILQKHFGLTAAETTLAKTLTNGCHSLVEAAAHLKVSTHTVRSHMKSIFSKTGCSSQVELVKMILTSPAILKQSADHLPHPSTAPHPCITLFDGKTLGYMEYGNPNGTPLIYCHALVHSHLQLLPNETLQDSADFRIIVPMRPGFLHSAWKPSKPSLQDHANDIIQLTKSLSIQKFHILGYSNGAPYAAALAYYFPEYTSSLTLAAPIVPPQFDSWKGLPTADRYMLHLGKRLPFKALNILSKVVLHSMSLRPDELSNRAFTCASPSEKEFLKSSQVKTYLKHWIEMIYPKRTRAVTHDMMVRVRPWGFAPQDIHVPTQIWHAQDDTISPFKCAAALAQAIPNAQLHTLDQDGHYILYSQFKRILTAIPQ
ncbi:MAG: alpha/beta fold hydrolase, partial [Ghiorsea sp.]|nr:alpha/beta fold hydrolase [Ghiorsea sp.]